MQFKAEVSGLIKRMFFSAVGLILMLFSASSVKSLGLSEAPKEVSYKVSVVRSEGGRVESDGRIIGGQLVLEKLKRQEYSFVPYQGYELYRVIYDDADVTDCVKDGSYTAEGITHDLTLTVLYRKCSELYTDSRVFPDEMCDETTFETGENNILKVSLFTAAFLSLAVTGCVILHRKFCKKQSKP